MDQNTLAEKDEFEHKMKEVTNICSPIMTKLHGCGSNGNHGDQPGRNGPTVEEVD